MSKKFKHVFLMRYLLQLGLYVVICAEAGTAFCRAQDLPLTVTHHLFDIRADFKQPSDIAIGKQGRIYVLDGVNHSVKVFDVLGKFLFAFGARGQGQGKFCYPLGLDIDKDGNVYVADSGNHLIQVFNAAGDFRYQFSLKASKAGKIPDPTDVVIDEASNRCYAVDNDNHTVLVYAKDGSRLLGQWGSHGEKRGQFQNPFFAAAGNDSSLYVVDVLNTRVQAYNAEGTVTSVIGGWGVDRGQFFRPKGIALDPRNRVFVSDSYLGVIQIFDQYGNFQSVVADEQGTILRLQTPVGIAVDEQLRLFVVEMVTNRISVYQLVEAGHDRL